MAEIYDGGTCTICDCVDYAKDGSMPYLCLVPIITSYFGVLKVGMNRAYLAKGADERIDYFVRIPEEGYRPRIGQYAVLASYEHEEDHANGDRYRITLVQPQIDEDGLPVYDLQLERLNDNYDIHRVNEQS